MPVAAYWQDGLKEALEAFERGRAVVFPTDTVYGLGVSVRHACSPDEIFQLKHRDARKPVAWLVEGVDDLQRYGRDLSAQALELVRAHWPGALTVVVRASEEVPRAFAPTGTIGLRMPASDCALELVRKVGPIAASSANRSGDATPRSYADLDQGLLLEVACALYDDGRASGVGSTVVDATGDALRILRQGGVEL